MAASKSNSLVKIGKDQWDALVDTLQDLVVGHTHNGVDSKTVLKT